MITLSPVNNEGGFRPIEEGLHVFKVLDVEYDKDFGEITLEMQIKDGRRHWEKFRLLNSNGEPNQGALNAFSYMARTLLDDFQVTQIDHTKLVGKYIKCEVTHNKVPSTKVPGEFVTFVNLGKKDVAKGFEGEEEVTKEETTLDDLLS